MAQPSVLVEAYAAELRRKIYERTKSTASIGIGDNMLLARLATKKVGHSAAPAPCSAGWHRLSSLRLCSHLVLLLF